MNSENESIRANPGASPERPIKKSGGGVLQDSINASPVRRRQAKQDSQLISEHLLHDSSPAPPADSLNQTKLPGGLQQPLLSPNDPEALLEEHLHENAADSPGTPEQLDAAQLGSAFTSAWVDSAQHEAHAEGAEQSFPGVHDSAQSEQPSDVRQTANLARVEASPQPRVLSAVPSPHDTPDGALVAGASTPDHPDDAAMRGSFASVIAGEDSFAEVSLLPNFSWRHCQACHLGDTNTVESLLHNSLGATLACSFGGANCFDQHQPEASVAIFRLLHAAAAGMCPSVALQHCGLDHSC